VVKQAISHASILRPHSLTLPTPPEVQVETARRRLLRSSFGRERPATIGPC
jgi:hypothetical protein